MNIATLLTMAADGFGDRVAVGDRESGLRFRDVLDRSHVVAARLCRSGAERLVHVGVNTDGIPSMLFGAALAGRPFTSVNYRLSDGDLRDAVRRSSPAIVVADAAADRVAGIEGTTVLAERQLFEAPDSEVGDLPEVSSDAVAITLFTSGTSGKPKSVLLRHRNLTSYILGTTEFMGAQEDEAALVSVPPYHIAGMASVLSNCYLGRRIVYLADFDAQTWTRTVLEQQITHAMVVPTMLSRILEEPRLLERLGSLRHLSYGGGRMPRPVIERALEELPNVDFVNAYGLTETSSTICLLGPEDHRRIAASEHGDVRARLGSVGRPIEGVELEIRDPDGGRLPAGVVGEIVVRGSQVSGEYRESQGRDNDGWFRTNDRGRIDNDGYVFLEGRADDVIVRGGENLSPGEIEDVLQEHPHVVDAGVVGTLDDAWGEAVAAFVVVREGESLEVDEVKAWVRARLRSSRTPSVVRFLPDLPYSETGKLLRRELRRLLETSP